MLTINKSRMLNTKKTIGNLLSLIGAPSYFIWKLGFANISKLAANRSHLVWAVPLAVGTAPFLSLAIVGESILLDIEKKDFLERTKTLPKIYLPKDYAYVIKSEEFGKNQYFVFSYYLEDEEAPFDTKQDAQLFLQSLGYQEVVALNYEYYLDTYWVKPADLNHK